MSTMPNIGDRIIVHQNQKDCHGDDILDRNYQSGYATTIKEIHKYCRTGIIKNIVLHEVYGYRAEIILDEKGKKPVTMELVDFNRIDGRLELLKGEFSLLEV